MRKYVLSLAVLAMSVCLYTACSSSSSDDDNVPENYVKTTEGVHRIEVSFNGDTDGWETSLTFIAVYGDGSHGKVKIYENGNLVGESSYQTKELRFYSVETEKKCDQMSLTIAATRDSKEADKSMTVTLRSFIDGKLVKSKTATFSANEYAKSIVFDSELDADIL